MGWCSATEIFDSVAGALLDDKPFDKKQVLRKLIGALEDGDWDCQYESKYFNHPLVKEIFKELHPRWFEEDDIK